MCSNSQVTKPALFCRVPRRCALSENEAAGATDVHRTGAVRYDVCFFLHRAVLSLWQDEWDNNDQGNKLRVVKPSVQQWLT